MSRAGEWLCRGVVLGVLLTLAVLAMYESDRDTVTTPRVDGTAGETRP